MAGGVLLSFDRSILRRLVVSMGSLRLVDVVSAAIVASLAVGVVLTGAVPAVAVAAVAIPVALVYPRWRRAAAGRSIAPCWVASANEPRSRRWRTSAAGWRASSTMSRCRSSRG